MLRKDSHPLVCAYGYKDKNSFVFILPGKEVRIEGANGLISFLLPRCAGYTTLEQICSAAYPKYSREEAVEVLSTLSKEGVVTEPDSYFLLAHLAGSNPMPFFKNLGDREIAAMLEQPNGLLDTTVGVQIDLIQLLQKRKSIRNFNGNPIPEEILRTLLWAMYGKANNHGTVPSGGGLYPLMLHTIILNGNTGVFVPEKDSIKKVGEVDSQKVNEIFFDGLAEIGGIAAIVVISSKFQKTTQKYSNRGYRFALLEAVHAAQNCYLYCAESSLIGSVEYGGFDDYKLAKLIGL